MKSQFNRTLLSLFFFSSLHSNQLVLISTPFIHIIFFLFSLYLLIFSPFLLWTYLLKMFLLSLRSFQKIMSLTIGPLALLSSHSPTPLPHHLELILSSSLRFSLSFFLIRKSTTCSKADCPSCCSLSPKDYRPEGFKIS